MPKPPADRDLAGPFLVAILFAAIIASHRHFIPYWDAENYAGCVSDAVQMSFNILNFRCVGHPSIAYLMFLGAFQQFSPWNVSLAYAANAMLGAASIYAFHGILRILLPGESAAEYSLVTALYALAPLFIAHALFLNLDYGVTAFFVLFLYFLLARRFWLASVFGVATMFSKEIGAAAYMLAVAAYAIAFVPRSSATGDARLESLRLMTPLAIPPLVLATYVLDFQMLQPSRGSWLASYAPVGIVADRGALLTMNPADPGIRSFLADIFILNYQWLYTAVLLAAVCRWLWRRREAGKAAAVGPGLFLCLLFVPLVYAVTRFRSYNNARYVLIASPVLIAIFHHALLFAFRDGTNRLRFLAGTMLLVTLSNFRTIDFVSKAVFGTFQFGSHALLDMPSLTGGPRMDSTVYNLEALQFGYLLNEMMQDVRPAPGAVVIMGDTTHFFPPKIDARSHGLTRDPSHALPLSVLHRDQDVQRDALRRQLREGDVFFYLAFANADNHELQRLLKEYTLLGTKQYERRGYTLGFYRFRFG